MQEQRPRDPSAARLLSGQPPFLPELSEQQRLRLQWDTAAALDLTVAFRDSLYDGGVGPELMVIPAGGFEMGSAPSEFGHRPEEGPLHYRHIDQPFALCRCPITADEFALFEQASGWRWRSDLIVAQGDLPVMNIRIADAERFCAWLSAQTGHRYRLPTEAEWEYACRAGTTSAFHYGDSVSCREVHFNATLPYEEARQKRRFFLPRCIPLNRALPVGGRPPNTWGLHDMHGNMWEFTSTDWDQEHRPEQRGGRHRRVVVKGGSWFDAAVYARSASRRPRLRDELDVNLGFRVLREL
jgi:formylglycine-generating enzyme required for sulfatase activity